MKLTGKSSKKVFGETAHLVNKKNISNVLHICVVKILLRFVWYRREKLKQAHVTFFINKPKMKSISLV